MANGIGFKQVGQLLSTAVKKGSIQAAVAQQVASQAKEQAKTFSIQTFGFDFTNLFTQLLVIYAVAFFIQIYVKAKLFFDNPEVQRTIFAGFFGIAGILWNLFAPKPETNPTKITENQFINELFSEEGFKGFKYWNAVNLLVALLIIATYFRHRRMTGNNVEPATTVGFILILSAVTLVGIIPVIKKLKVTDFNIESLR